MDSRFPTSPAQDSSSSSSSSGNPQPDRPTLVLSLGLLRTGTASIAAALRILGYHNVWHGIDAISNSADWAVLNRAADATFPNLPSYTGKAFTRADWDEIWGPCEAITDIGSIFSAQLVEVYPEAKVVLVERDVDKWFASIDEGVFSSLWGMVPDFFVGVVEPLIGSVSGPASRKHLLGFFGARDVDELRVKAKNGYKAHYRRVREMVPEGRLLDFKIEEGWEPLCEFLGKEIPVGVPFPHVNDADALKAKLREHMMNMLKSLGSKAGPWAAAALTVMTGVYFARGQDLI
ncbi:hypothetical protein N0V82_010079 [Gnomoniopsis sp. IMI 355080]|nr:hypothetical protein N0V82_010079 [Gnomoniopsis sp. IMI 355080]